MLENASYDEFSKCVTDQIKTEKDLFEYITATRKDFENYVEQLTNMRYNTNFAIHIGRLREIYSGVNTPKLYTDKYQESFFALKELNATDFSKVDIDLELLVNEEPYDIVTIAVILGNENAVSYFFQNPHFEANYKTAAYYIATWHRYSMLKKHFDLLEKYLTPEVCIAAFDTRLLADLYLKKVDMVSANLVDLAQKQNNYGCLEILMRAGNSSAPLTECDIINELISLKYNITADLILQQGFDINHKDADGMTPLIQATYDDDLNSTVYLVEKGADLEIKDSDGMSALAVATYYGSYKIAQFLIDKGADKESRNNSGTTPLLTALYNDDKDTIKFMMRNNANMRETFNGFCPIVHASKMQNLNTVSFLFANGASVNSVDGTGDTPLLAASENACEDIIKFLCHNGAKVGTRDDKKNTPLIKVSMFKKRQSTFDIRKETEKRYNSAKLLLHYGQNPNDVNSEGKSALHYAIKQSDILLTNLLLENGADINLKDNNGNTPLSIAIANDDVGMAKELQAKGATIDKNALEKVSSPEMKAFLLQDANIKSKCCLLI